MKIAIMQPYFLPYLGYFQLIKHVDLFVIFDDVQYIRRGWINRNRILNSNGCWSYINVPVIKNKREALIKDISINNNISWRQDIYKKLEYYNKKSPYYNQISEELNSVLSNDFNYISDLNISLLSTLCKKIDIDFNYIKSSKLDICYSDIDRGEEKIIKICKLLNANEYINLYGGYDLYNVTKFQTNGIDLSFIKMDDVIYNQNIEHFEPSLSIVDVLMFNSIDKLKYMLDNSYSIIKK